MKVITEAILRSELKSDDIVEYEIPDGKLLSPAAREYLQQRKIKIVTKEQLVKRAEEEKKEERKSSKPPVQSTVCNPEAKFVDYVTGAFYYEKPEHMTHLKGNVLVNKNHKRIALRGKIDSLEAQIVLTQATLASEGASERLIRDLGDILRVVTLIMRSDVLDLPFENEMILGMSKEEIHERSHNPLKFYNVKQLLLADYSMGKEYAMINLLRAQVRELEVVAVDAYFENGKYTKEDIVKELNRLSSCMHLIGCMYLAGEYK